MITGQAVDLTAPTTFGSADERRRAGAAENPADQTETKDKE